MHAKGFRDGIEIREKRRRNFGPFHLAGHKGVEAAKQPLGMYMTDPAGLRFQMLPVLILVPMNLALSWVLIAPLGSAGPIVGSVLSVIVCQVIPYGLWVRRDLRRRRARAAAGENAD